MTCPYCNAQLIYHNYTYRGNLAAYEKGYPDSGFQKTGDVYKCPNVDGFDDLDEASYYLLTNSLIENPEDVVCDSNNFGGLYWRETNGNIHEGAPY